MMRTGYIRIRFAAGVGTFLTREVKQRGARIKGIVLVAVFHWDDARLEKRRAEGVEILADAPAHWDNLYTSGSARP